MSGQRGTLCSNLYHLNTWTEAENQGWSVLLPTPLCEQAYQPVRRVHCGVRTGSPEVCVKTALSTPDTPR